MASARIGGTVGASSKPRGGHHMKQGIGATVAAIAMLLAGVGAANAHTTEYDSFLFIENGGFGKGTFVDAYGFSFSKVNEKCIPDRKVKLRVFGEGLDPLTVDS